MSNEHVMECVVYQIHDEWRADFIVARKQVLAEMQALPGFVAYDTFQNTEDGTQMIDMVWWRDAATAEAAFQAWKQWPSAKQLMQTVESVTYSAHFKKLDG
ncbi:antibiotic biosynthesis monooxygenase family protein [Acanthopleuribacter pedis]|uniref:Antibiotic biosynthesis monooxygenase n=1 Tax=Acanthopleuribacter pedis TaxID=442870 RepID=A0A8J7QG24_9BACT|nr:antibiotic biosynthesis monooxygenase [Acanthopleuribacter pedis]MBO1317860.1 antibiotic biosynthesis monooxygenase [Acanthopleuribacter pedis]